MVMVVAMIAALLLGFVAGRVWEIRQHIIRVGNRRREADSGVVTEGPEEPESHDPVSWRLWIVRSEN